MKANPTGGADPISVRQLGSIDARFKINGFKKFHQSIPGAKGKGISIHYQYDAATGRIVDIKVTSPIENSK